MINILDRLIAGAWRWVALAGAVMLMLLQARQSGKSAADTTAVKQTLKGVTIRDRIEKNTISAAVAERKRLLEKWTKRN